MKRIAILGSGGYVGVLLARELLRSSAPLEIVGFGSFWFSDPPTQSLECGEPIGIHRMKCFKADIRDGDKIQAALQGVDTLIHLACISNDPGVDLNPEWAKSINLDSFDPIMAAAVSAGVKHVIYASSSSVYGACAGKERDESDKCNPLTDYAKFKLHCEDKIAAVWGKVIPITIVRPATLFGWTDTAMRFDLMLNAFISQAATTGTINVRGGEQMRSLLHVEDMVQLYVKLSLEDDMNRVGGMTWNVSHASKSLQDLAFMVAKWRQEDGKRTGVQFEPTQDLRSYAINATAIEEQYDFVASRSLESGYKGIADKVPADWDSAKYMRVKGYREVMECL